MSNKNPYSKVTKHMSYPKGLKKFAKEHENSNYNGLHRIQYINYYSMLDGKPLKRVFAFAHTSTYKTEKGKQTFVKEVARYYDHKQFLTDAMYTCLGAKRICWTLDGRDFYMHPENSSPSNFWEFFPSYNIQDLDEFLVENKLLYTGWNPDIKMDFNEYLTFYLDNPKVELLSKAKLDYWIPYLKYLDTSKKTLHEIFKIKQESTNLLWEKDFGFIELLICRRIGATEMSAIHKQKVIEDNVKRYLSRCRSFNRTVNQSVKEVLCKQATYIYMKYKFVAIYNVYDYFDYLDELAALGAINDEKALYPDDFQKVHEETSAKYKLVKAKSMYDSYEKMYKEYSKYNFSSGGLFIRPVEKPEELYKESEILHHCVRTYDRNVAAGTTEIMFIREDNKPLEPFFTLEIKEKKIIQVRGDHNKEPTDAVREFVTKWAKEFKLNYTGKQAQFNYY